jgi:hypothetical protein
MHPHNPSETARVASETYSASRAAAEVSLGAQIALRRVTTQPRRSGPRAPLAKVVVKMFEVVGSVVPIWCQTVRDAMDPDGRERATYLATMDATTPNGRKSNVRDVEAGSTNLPIPTTKDQRRAAFRRDLGGGSSR